MCVCVYLCVCVYIYTTVCVCVCVCVCVYTHIHAMTEKEQIPQQVFCFFSMVKFTAEFIELCEKFYKI